MKKKVVSRKNVSPVSAKSKRRNRLLLNIAKNVTQDAQYYYTRVKAYAKAACSKILNIRYDY